MGAIHITKENFEQEVLQSEKQVLIDFSASWCGPCKMLAPVIDDLAEEVQDTKICKVDVDEQPELRERYDIMSFPTLVLIKNGEVIKKAVGRQTRTEILELLK